MNFKDPGLWIIILILLISIMLNIIQLFGSYSRMGLDDLYDNFPSDKKDSKRLITEVKMESDKGNCNINIEHDSDIKKVEGKGSEGMECGKYDYNDSDHTMSNFTKQLINADV